MSQLDQLVTWIALLRGVNVGGHGKLPMAELRKLLTELGYSQVRTTIQSGNVVLKSESACAQKIAGAIEQQFGFRPDVIVLSEIEFRTAAEANPYAESTHFYFLDQTPEAPNLAKLTELKASDEQFSLLDKVFYLHAPAGIGRSKLAARAEKLLGVAATARNQRTVAKLLEMLEDG